MSSDNYRKKKKRRRKRIRVGRLSVVLLVAAAILILGGLLIHHFVSGGSETTSSDNNTENVQTDKQGSADSENTDTSESAGTDIALGSNIYVTDIDSYLGDYVEDGSDEYVDGIMMITVENRGEENLQLADIVINGTYQFELTTLLPGDKMIVLETNRQAYDPSLTVESVELTNVAIFQEEPSLHEDQVSFTTSDYSIVVKNISEETTPEGKIFYKNHLEDGTLLGGITYCGSIPALEPGEEVTLTAAHFTVDSSEISFVTFGE